VAKAQQIHAAASKALAKYSMTPEPGSALAQLTDVELRQLSFGSEQSSTATSLQELLQTAGSWVPVLVLMEQVRTFNMVANHPNHGSDAMVCSPHVTCAPAPTAGHHDG